VLVGLDFVLLIDVPLGLAVVDYSPQYRDRSSKTEGSRRAILRFPGAQCTR
jgi:hypothetical protein